MADQTDAAPRISPPAHETVQALRGSKEAFAELMAVYNECGTLFDEGRDSEGANAIAEKLHPRLLLFANFIGTLRQTTDGALSPKTAKAFADACASFEKVIDSLQTEIQGLNFIEVGDIIRFDLLDLTKTFAALFETMANEIEAEKTPS